MSETRNPRLDIDPVLLRRLYVDEMKSTKELQQLFHIQCKNLELTLDYHGIPRRTKRGPRSPQHHGSWTGGKIVDKDGYILVMCHGHPDANKAGYVREHRLVMEKKIGRRLLKKEVVHHKDGVKSNNAPENLELFAKNSDHLRHELTGKCPKWTEEGRKRILAGVSRKRKPRRSQPIAQDTTEPDAAASS